MTGAGFQWLGIAIMTVEHEVISSGRTRDRVMRLLANNETQREKAVGRMTRTGIRVARAQQAMAQAKAVEQRKTEFAQSIAEANAKGVTP